MNEADKKAFEREFRHYVEQMKPDYESYENGWIDALAHRDKQAGEPVARVIDDGTPGGSVEWIPVAKSAGPLSAGDLLYTAPPAPTVAVNEQILELMEHAAMALGECVQFTQNGYDEPPEPATEWDSKTYQLACEISAAISAAKAARGE